MSPETIKINLKRKMLRIIKMELKAGDKICAISYGKIVGVYTVETVGKKFAVCDNGVKFFTEYNEWLRKSPTERWASTRYKLMTDQLRHDIAVQNLKKRISSCDLSTLKEEQLRAIWSIMEGTK